MIEEQTKRATRVVVDHYSRIGHLQIGINETLEELEKEFQAFAVEDIRLTSHQETSVKIVLVLIRYSFLLGNQQDASE